MQTTLASKFQHHLAVRQAVAATLTVPVDWLTQAAQLPGKSFHVAVVIALARRRSSGQPISLRQQDLRQLGVSRDAGYDALGRLEAAGLISVARGRGRRPFILLAADSL